MARLGFRDKGGDCGFGGFRGTGRRFYRGGRGAWAGAPGGHGGAEIPVRFGRVSGSDLSSETSPTGGSHLAVREARGGRGTGYVRAGPGKEKGKGRAGQVLGHGDRKKREKESGAGGGEKQKREEMDQMG